MSNLERLLRIDPIKAAKIIIQARGTNPANAGWASAAALTTAKPSKYAKTGFSITLATFPNLNSFFFIAATNPKM